MHDPEWESADLDAAMDWQYQRSLLCSGCGHPMDETTDDEIRSAWAAERVTCWACAAKERASRRDNDGVRRPPPGSRYQVRNRARE